MDAQPEKPLSATYEEWIANSIDERGVAIPQAMCLHADGKLTVYALAVPPEQGYQLMVSTWERENPAELIFAFDRFTKPDQGTTLSDVLAGWHFTQDRFRPFIIEYQHEPRIVRPICWDNAFWTHALGNEMLAAAAPIRATGT